MTKTVATKVSAHITSAFLGGAFATAQFRHYNAWEGDLSGISPDELALTMALPVAVFAVIFGTGHFALRSINVRARLMYPFLGAVALISASLAAMPMELTQTAVEKGIVSIFLALTSSIGALIGFLHLRSAGYEVDEDEIAQFEHTISMGVDDSLESMTTSSLHDFPEKSAQHQQQEAVPSRDGEIKDKKIGVLKTESSTFFDGPLQVITSGNAVFAAALAGALVHFLYSALYHLGVSNGNFGASESLKENVLSGDIFSGVVFGLLFSIIVCSILLPPAIYALHKLLVSRKRADMLSYVVAGGALPLGLGLLMFGFGLLLTHWLILPLAVAMGVYHRLAGVEPAALPEDIEVSDPRTLIGENHVRRRMRRVVG